MLSKDDKKRIAEEERYRDEVRGKSKRGEPLDDDKAKPATSTKNTVSNNPSPFAPAGAGRWRHRAGAKGLGLFKPAPIC